MIKNSKSNLPGITSNLKYTTQIMYLTPASDYICKFTPGIREGSLESLQLPVQLVGISVGEKLTWLQIYLISTQENRRRL